MYVIVPAIDSNTIVREKGSIGSRIMQDEYPYATFLEIPFFMRYGTLSDMRYVVKQRIWRLIESIQNNSDRNRARTRGIVEKLKNEITMM